VNRKFRQIRGFYSPHSIILGISYWHFRHKNQGEAELRIGECRGDRGCGGALDLQDFAAAGRAGHDPHLPLGHAETLRDELDQRAIRRMIDRRRGDSNLDRAIVASRQFGLGGAGLYVDGDANRFFPTQAYGFRYAACCIALVTLAFIRQDIGWPRTLP
jgi:hypothetical protein